MRAGAAKIDITPSESIEMDGMLRAHGSVGVHDPLYAGALVVSNSASLAEACAIVSVDICRLVESLTTAVRDRVAAEVGIPAERIMIAAKHTHSGPAAHTEGQAERAYAQVLQNRLVEAIAAAAAALAPVRLGSAAGQESTISEYRRLLHRDGHVVMNWETYDPAEIVGPLGQVDAEVGVARIVDLSDQAVCLLVNHAGHPNVLSGDNYLLSADYPGFAERLLEAEFGGQALFVNGAQGTMDVDGHGPRDWEEMERLGRKLAQAAAATARTIKPVPDRHVRCASARYGLPARRISDQQLAWAERIIEQTGGVVVPLADGVGDDYKALLYKRLRAQQDREIPAEQLCIALGDCAFLSFPGELYTEIGLRIKAASPFENTCVVGLANGYIGYIPTRKAVQEGGYAEDVREVDEAAEDVVVEKSLALLEQVYRSDA